MNNNILLCLGDDERFGYFLIIKSGFLSEIIELFSNIICFLSFLGTLGFVFLLGFSFFSNVFTFLSILLIVF